MIISAAKLRIQASLFWGVSVAKLGFRPILIWFFSDAIAIHNFSFSCLDLGLEYFFLLRRSCLLRNDPVHPQFCSLVLITHFAVCIIHVPRVTTPMGGKNLPISTRNDFPGIKAGVGSRTRAI